MNFKHSLLGLCFLFLVGGGPTAATPLQNPSPRVAVSITPFYALVAAVMQGVGTPQLLIQKGSCPHEYALKPSEAQHLHAADIIFWAGPGLETFLVKSLATIEMHHPHSIVTLEQTPGLHRLPQQQNAEGSKHDHNHVHHHPHSIDMHFWLDPQNAIALTDNIVQQLSLIDPNHATLYHQNGQALKERLRNLDEKIAQTLKAVKHVPFIVFHDAYQYFAKRYELTVAASITAHPEVPPSAKRINTVRKIIQESHAHCIFTEPNLQPKLVNSLAQEFSLKIGELDPVGSASNDNPDGYFQLLQQLTESVHACLQKAE